MPGQAQDVVHVQKQDSVLVQEHEGAPVQDSDIVFVEYNRPTLIRY